MALTVQTIKNLILCLEQMANIPDLGSQRGHPSDRAFITIIWFAHEIPFAGHNSFSPCLRFSASPYLFLWRPFHRRDPPAQIRGFYFDFEDPLPCIVLSPVPNDIAPFKGCQGQKTQKNNPDDRFSHFLYFLSPGYPHLTFPSSDRIPYSHRFQQIVEGIRALFFLNGQGI